MRNILIADDNDEIREIVRILLESEGFNVSEAINGEDAVNKVNDNTDLIILDNKSTQALSDFKSYVLKNNISINDHEKIEKWVRNYKYVDIYIFKNNTLVYNSTRYASYSDYETLVETTNISDYFDDISFYDANGKVYMD